MTITAMAIASLGNVPERISKIAEITATAISITNIMLVNCSQRIVRGLLPPVDSSSLTPKYCCRCVTSDSVNPSSRSLPSNLIVSAISTDCQGCSIWGIFAESKVEGKLITDY